MTENINLLGCGYIGKKVAEKLHNKNVALSCFVKTEKSKDTCLLLSYKTQQFDLDKKNMALTENAVAAFKNSTVAYFVAPQPEGVVDQRMQNFVTSLENASVSVSKILLISTTGVYGNCHGEWIDESRATQPQADRARRRLSAEMLLNAYCEKNKISLVVFRVPGIYAADKLPLKRICSGEPVVNAQDSGYTNRIHADDLAAFCVEALTENVTPGIYNCCDGSPSTMNDYFMKVADAMSLPYPKEISLQQAQQELSKGMLSYLAESKRISNKKLLENFNTQFHYPDLKSGLKSLAKSV